MALDPKYVLAPSLQEFFIDKDSGLPMVAGKVYFYDDNQRNIPKDVFEISGSPPNYSYTVLPNPVTLSAVGTFQDASGNDILPYYYPYDADGNIQLYYIEVFNQDGVLQFTREGFPNTSAEDILADQDITNFVANGQFLLHNDIPAWSGNDYELNEISADVTEIAPGGWSFERSAASTATDLVSFFRYGSSVQNPTGNPRFAVEIETTSAGSDSRKDLCLKFPDVNKFASTTQPYNLYFEGQSLSGSGLNNIQIIIRKFFGSGGSPSPTTETNVTTINLTPTMQSYNVELLFGINTNKSLGTNNDDFVQIVLRLPPTGTQDVLFTDFALTINSEELTSYPTQTNAVVIDQSTIGFLASDSPDGNDLYLPILLTLSGTIADHSEIGKVYSAIYNTPGIAELLCDGSQYLTADYATSGIPYARLQRVLYALGVANGIQAPQYGTGANFATSYINNSNTAILRISTNKPLAQTSAIDGAPPTGFAFATIATGQTTLVNAYSDAAAQNIVIGQAAGVGGAVDINSGCTISQSVNNVFSYQVFTVTTPAAASITTGHYFTYNTPTTNYYVWFNINGGGGDPAVPGRTGIAVAIPSTYTAQDVADAVREAMNGSQISTVTTVAASGITASANFTFVANSVTYYVWYQVAGTGSAPGASATPTAIKVTLAGTETAAQVTAATQIAINSFMYAVPDFRGLFLRGVRGTGQWDLNAATRWSDLSGVFGNKSGTFEIDTFQSHVHSYVDTFLTENPSFTQIQGGTDWQETGHNLNTGAQGFNETRPLNASVNWFIKF